MLLRKKRSRLEIYNDIDGGLVTFFRVLRDQPKELIRKIKLTPYAKAEWELELEEDLEPMELARRFYAKAYMSFAGPRAQRNTGWRRQKVITKRSDNSRSMTPASISFMRTDHLLEVANRLRGVQIECDDALAVIRRYDTPSTLFYVDPPYPWSTRSKKRRRAYIQELSDEEHIEICETLQGIKGMALISGYRCDLYDKLYGGWRRVEKETRVQGGRKALENLWLSPSLIEAWRKLPLFSTLTSKV